MRTGVDQIESWRAGRHLEAVRPIAEQTAALLARQQEAGEAPGKRRLANPARARDQPGVVQAARPLRGEHRLLGGLVSHESVVAPGRRPGVRPFELLELGRVGSAGLAARHQEPSLSATTPLTAAGDGCRCPWSRRSPRSALGHAWRSRESPCGPARGIRAASFRIASPSRAARLPVSIRSSTGRSSNQCQVGPEGTDCRLI